MRISSSPTDGPTSSLRLSTTGSALPASHDGRVMDSPLAVVSVLVPTVPASALQSAANTWLGTSFWSTPALVGTRMITSCDVP